MVAIQYTGPVSPRIEEGDTVRLTAVALGFDGKPIEDAPVVWRLMAANPDTVGITLDSLSGLVTATFPGGPWQVQGRVGDLRTNPPIQVSVLAAPDTVIAVDPTRVTVEAGATESSTLATGVYDLTTQPGQQLPLSGRPVVFRLAEPLPGSPAASTVALAPASGNPGPDPHVLAVATSTGGLARATARRIGTSQPDSIIVEALAFTARGDTVAGSPVRFVVLFVQN